jgi:Zn-dependent peptidase ImmA (M78 family)/transcriptional regulator with XRE-family HTH domain
MKLIVGTKLKKAREDIGLTQEALAEAVGLSSEYISLLESGKRTPSLETLTNISEYLKKEISYFMKKKGSAFDILLGGERLDKDARRELMKFRTYCEEYINLEELTGCRLELAPLYSHVSAERMADEERCRLGLKSEPIRDIFSLMELNGCRVIRQPIPEESQISGVFIHLEEKEASFALINSTLSPGQQVFTAAHEYGHYLKDRSEDAIIDNPDIFVDEFLSLYHPREKFAQVFAAQFLMPPSKVSEIIDKDFRSGKLRFENVICLKRYFGVSFFDMLRTLKKLEYLSTSKFEEYLQLDPDFHEEALFGNLEDERGPKRRKGKPVVSDRFRALAIKAFQRKKISAEKLSGLLNQDKDKLVLLLAKS